MIAAHLEQALVVLPSDMAQDDDVVLARRIVMLAKRGTPRHDGSIAPCECVGAGSQPAHPRVRYFAPAQSPQRQSGPHLQSPQLQFEHSMVSLSFHTWRRTPPPFIALGTGRPRPSSTTTANSWCSWRNRSATARSLRTSSRT